MNGWKARLNQAAARNRTMPLEKIVTVFKDAALTLVIVALGERCRGCTYLEVGIPDTETTEIHVDKTLAVFVKAFLEEQMKYVGMAVHCEWVE